MTDIDKSKLSWDEWDELQNPPPAEIDFDRVVEAAVSRRGFLGGILAMGSAAAAMGTLGAAANLMSSTSAQAQEAAASRFAFKPIPIFTDNTVHVPEGYSWKPLAKWGQPLFSNVPDMDPATGVSLENSDKVFGENTDGMELFVIGEHQVIAVNHEYVNNETNLPNNEKGMPKSADEVKILQNLQGVTVMEVAEGENGWEIKLDSPFNRRITHLTPMKISGPAAGSDLIKTEADPNGTDCLGTFNNCGAGKTPWGTYLTCEENFNGYFGSTDPNFAMPDDFKRYGIVAETRYGYEAYDPRFDVSKNPNEPRRAGYVVEIDPSDASSTPFKRTALGRFKHENAAVVIARDGRVVVYMGDDERGEFLYKFVSNGIYVPGNDTSKLLDEGTLFVAKFGEDGTGEWVALTPESTGMKLDEICVFTRQAASKVGATTMDRPEWVAINPVAIEAYCALTNNTNRGVKKNAGGDEMPVGGANPREKNAYGQIVRWYPENDDHADSRFKWDLFVMAGNPDVHKDANAGSSNVNSGNMFNSPDGMIFDSTGLLWIQTDGEDTNEGDFAGQGNNQMLAGDPATGRIERFLTGPLGCEVTGLIWSADRRTMFVGIQHPNAPFPDGEGKLPRSTLIAVKRDDNALIG
ncbi:PhoX family protein [Sinorhizobium meliloti]|uniref:PhoX family protein n=1 Tax=Rhizobium meliloti TaxID=382 RepID=UPI000FD84A42|nr:PhoX family phosphatase [Sinorhizobium meliloti]RVH11530.1 PhoX family phosphatase [Sinorhizobium meliloti]RVH53191.1 PhoX family phosphatase [Sinorhizobium meliloti]RVI55278.1 PhoX family phosphatase [Sinorhizobium meliloti]